ncbi:vWA domain-containing protein [Haliangium sp. UPWRP_2]|uniref:vWA domain-containing protein n=1 Tax=Haliangium sp. UPWRP_2 TaxID=1931276 RepID=UPI000D0D6101|nr:vWA domain-containing protein [Haliangium sp. UPWRP_2]PSM31867.1 hypothetical protein BVG81_003140 [Haliangium sp. UPWRP_2]
MNAQADLRYLDGIVEILREPLGAEHADLARYTHGVRLYADGDMTGAAALLDPFLKDGHAKLGGLELAVPPVPTPLPKPIEDGPGPKRSELRARINEILPTVVDLRAFCLDYFPTISMQSHASASRQEIVNVILERIEPRELAEALDRSQSAAIRREPAKTSRAEIRRRLAQEFKTEADFDVFCLDFFPAIRKRFANSMDRIAKYNILLELAEPQAIVRSLDIYKEEILRERSSVSELRKRIDKAFPTTESFEVVCLDYFPEIVSQFTVGMTRTARVTLLLSKVSTDEIEKVLEKLESEIGQRREWNSRDNLRKRLWHELPTQPDFDAFCIDYFPETFKLFTSGMERLQKESLLLTREVPERIVEALNQHQSIPPAEPVQYNAPYVSDSASARRVTRRSPLRIIMAIDDSGSMRGMPAEQTLMAIRKFLQELQLRVTGKTELIFVSAIIFGTNAKITVAHADIGTIDPDADIVEIRGLHGGTNIAKALQSARRIIAETKFSASDLPPWIILYTDGNADDPAEALEEARILRSLPLPCESPRIAAVFINNNVDTRFYEQLATAPEYCLGLADVSSIMMLLPEFGP